MLQYHQGPASSQSRSANTEFASKEIETYLDRISPPAEAALTEAARQECRAEMKTHLESLIAAYIELGDSHEQAVAKALQQFGATGSVRRAWTHALSQTNSASLRQPFGLALLCNTTVCLAAIVIPMGVHWTDSLGMNRHTFADAVLYTLPANAGVLTGLLARNRPVRATLYAWLALLPPMMLFDALQAGKGMWPSGLLSQLAAFGLLWIPVSCATAGIAGRLRQWVLRSWQKRIAS